jgi:hypothetical protein
VEILDAAVAEPSGHSRCEFCGQRIRWMHILEHDEYDRTMRAGCCCAEKYCNDYDAAGAEKAMKARAGRRRTFANLERWRPSRYNAENRVRKHRCVDGTKLRVTPKWAAMRDRISRPIPSRRSRKPPWPRLT